MVQKLSIVKFREAITLDKVQMQMNAIVDSMINDTDLTCQQVLSVSNDPVFEIHL